MQIAKIMVKYYMGFPYRYNRSPSKSEKMYAMPDDMIAEFGQQQKIKLGKSWETIKRSFHNGSLDSSVQLFIENNIIKAGSIYI